MTTAPRRRRVQPRKPQAGQGLVEYALILSLVAIVAIAALTFLGSTVAGYLTAIGTSI